MSEYAVMPLNDYVNICDAVRDKTNTTDSVKSTEMADKITQVHNAGQISALETSEHIKGNASGNVITVNDISPVEHAITVKISSDTVEDLSTVSISRYGKNLFDINSTPNFNTHTGQTITKIDDVTFKTTISFTTGGGNGIYLGCFNEGTVLTVSGEYKLSENATLDFADILSHRENGTVTNYTKYYPLTNDYTFFTHTITLEKSGEYWYRPSTRDYYSSTDTVYVELKNLQIEIGDTATDYEVFKEPKTVTANADGTVEGLTSLHPNITVFTDNPDVNIELGYFKEIDSVYEAGQKAENDRLWDIIQQNGKRTAYMYGFAGKSWTDATFEPRYNIDLYNNGAYAFYFTNIYDLEAALDKHGVMLDFSRTTTASYVFAQSIFKVLPVIDFSTSKANDAAYWFYTNPYLETIRKFIVKETTSYTGTFRSTPALKNIEFEGVIGNDISFSDSPLLSKNSITNIISVLSSSTTDKTATFSLTAVNNAFETSEGAADGSTSDEWLSLVATKSNWTISLA